MCVVTGRGVGGGCGVCGSDEWSLVRVVVCVEVVWNE